MAAFYKSTDFMATVSRPYTLSCFGKWRVGWDTSIYLASKTLMLKWFRGPKPSKAKTLLVLVGTVVMTPSKKSRYLGRLVQLNK